MEVVAVVVPYPDGDQAIPPAQRMGATTIEVTTNHVAMVSHPEDVAQIIETAINSVSPST